MTLPLLLLHLFALVSAALDSPAARQTHVNRAVNVGDNVTLECPHTRQVFKYYWFKQSLGETPRLVAIIYRGAYDGVMANELINNTRFTISINDTQNNLQMSRARPSDAATYSCAMSHSMTFEFVRSVTVFVKGAAPRVQQPTSCRDLDPGQSAVLNCSVQTGACEEGAPDVYWFKESETAEPGLLYGHSDQCEPDVTSASRSCVYNLRLSDVRREQSGTYYCAVAACARVVFGDGTRLVIGGEASSVCVRLLSAAVVVSCSLFFAVALCLCFKSREESKPRASAKTEGLPRLVQFEVAQPQDGQHRRKTDARGTWSECIYLSVV